jgi:tetratricopeptide (TPR) repeat protein
VSRTLATVALGAWIFVFLAFAGSELVSYQPALRLATIVAYGGPLAVWAALRLRRSGDRLDLAVCVALVIYALVSFLSVDLTGSLETLGLATGFALLFLAMREAAASPALKRRIAVAAVTAMIFTLCLTAWLWIDEKVAWIAAGGGMPQLAAFEMFVWETPNAMPIFTLLVIPFLAWLLPGTVRRVLIGLVIAASLVTVPMSTGRSGWLALATAALAAAALELNARRSRTGAPTIPWIPIAGVLATVAVAAGLLLREPIIRSLEVTGRLTLWEQGLTMFASAPLSGGGPSTYSWLRLLFEPDSASILAVRLIHNVPLQTAIDGGLLLIAGLGLVVGAWGWHVARRIDKLDPRQRLALATLIGFGVASLLDDFSFLPAVTALVVTLAAWTAGPGGTSNVPRGLGPVALVALIGVLSLPFVTGAALARHEAAAGRAAAVAANWAEAAARFSAASSWYPTNAGYAIGSALSLAAAGDIAGGRSEYQRAVRLSPGDPRGYGGLAALADDRDERIGLLHRAAERTLGSPHYAYRLAHELESAGDHEGALTAFGQAVALEPELILLIAADAVDLERLAAAGRQASEILVSSHRREAEWDLQLAAGGGGEAPAAWRTAQALKRDDLPAAEEHLDTALVETPHDVRTYLAMAAVAVARCDQNMHRDAQTFVRLLRGDPEAASPGAVQIVIEGVYREPGLGSSQPPGTLSVPEPDVPWPWSLIGAPEPCPGLQIP